MSGELTMFYFATEMEFVVRPRAGEDSANPNTRTNTDTGGELRESYAGQLVRKYYADCHTCSDCIPISF
jgi:hypothetical protein